MDLLFIVFIISFAFIWFIAKGKTDVFSFSPYSNFYYHRLKHRTRIRKRDFDLINDILIKKFSYYRSLSEDGKAKFVHRMVDILRDFQFEGKEGLKITPEMKTMVCGTLTQVTYGLKHYTFDAFHTVYLYPKSFYVPQINQVLKGGITPNGFIALSWADLKAGYEVEDDGYNLGLHETAHVLKIQMAKGREIDEEFAFYLQHWLNISNTEYQQIRRGMPSFLRSYAGVNTHEFFAVCLEHFFEVPETFATSLPDVYNHMCVLLNQNMLNPQQDYKLTIDYIKEVNIHPNRVKMPVIKARS